MLFVVRVLLLCCIVFLGPLLDTLFDSKRDTISYYIPLTCNKGYAYPLRFLLVFALDVISALIDLIIFIVSPKIENRRKRLRDARQADIEAAAAKRIKENQAQQ